MQRYGIQLDRLPGRLWINLPPPPPLEKPSSVVCLEEEWPRTREHKTQTSPGCTTLFRKNISWSKTPVRFLRRIIVVPRTNLVCFFCAPHTSTRHPRAQKKVSFSFGYRASACLWVQESIILTVVRLLLGNVHWNSATNLRLLLALV